MAHKAAQTLAEAEVKLRAALTRVDAAAVEDNDTGAACWPVRRLVGRWDERQVSSFINLKGREVIARAVVGLEHGQHELRPEIDDRDRVAVIHAPMCIPESRELGGIRDRGLSSPAARVRGYRDSAAAGLER